MGRARSLTNPTVTFSLFLLQVLFFFSSHPSQTLAFVPPRPGSDAEASFEPVHLYRKRLGIKYNYTPTLLSPETCRFLTPAECEQADQSMQEHATAHRKAQKALYHQRERARKRRFLTEEEAQRDFQEQLGAFTKAYGNPHEQPTLEEELAELTQLLQEFNTTKEAWRRERRRLQIGGPSDRTTAQHNPSLGQYVVPLFLMKFTDHKNRPVPEKYHYQILWNLRIKKWLDENSYGQYNAFFDVQDWEVTDNTEKHYSFGNYGRVSQFQESFWPLLDSMDARLEGDWSLYDVDGDGYLDNLIVIHSGYAAEEGGKDCTNGRENKERIWSHAFSNSNGWTSSNGQYQVRGYNIASSLDLKCDYEVGRMGVMTHEYLHTFYLIDLYDLQFVGKGVGNFDIMGYPYGHKNDGYIPVNLSPWAKVNNEWLTCTEITQSGEYDIEPAAFSPSCFKIVLLSWTKWDEYILLENRQQASFDIMFWEPGLVMYHVDEAAEDQMWAGAPGFPDWPFSGDHYRIAVIQADGAYDMENGKNNGDKGDIWQPGDILEPNFDNMTYPNTDSYQDGIIEVTGISIEVLESQGSTVRIKVTFPERSGDDDDVQKVRPEFAAPQKEPLHDLAQDQFTVPDDSENRISGMIPQLPWFESWRKETSSCGRLVRRRSWGVVMVAAVTFLASSL